jgi:hypothetical protein
MGDLKTPFGNAAYPNTTDLGGELPTSRGTDPNIDTGAGGAGGLKDNWPGAVVPVPGGEETANSVSGLPLQPNRFQPSETPPEPPTLQDRNPGTIDKR